MRALEHERYVTWDFYKAKLQSACDVAEGDTDALRKMQNMKYKGDIIAYLDRLRFLNERAGITKAALTDVVRKAFPNEIIWILLICGGIDMDKQIWKTVKKAGKAHEETEYVIK